MARIQGDAASRLQSVTDGTNSASYSYLDNSSLVGQIVFSQNGATRMTTSRTYDNLNRLTAVSSINYQQSTINSSAYGYNSANQRTRNTEADGSYWAYEYDALGQVKTGKKYWSDQTPVAGQQFEYGFDDIGNRTQTRAGGDENGANLRVANYSANLLNQYTNRDVPGYAEVTGLSLATNTVTVNGLATYRKGEYFWKELGFNNTNAVVWTNVTVAATGQTSVTGNVFVAKSPEAFGYDADGNLTNDGHWSYTWDAENRLVAMTNNANLPSSAKLALNFVYDYQGRRIQKLVCTNNGTAYYPRSTNTFLYDGWNLLAELRTPNSPIRTYMWGLDLSGSMQGAGGVGGLLAVSDASTLNAQPSTHFACFDGNGNVVGLVNAADGTASAQYGYGPFGELLRATGPMAKANPFRFSTKYQDDESDLLYYGCRYYGASTGRWLGRDPSEENGGVNLYGFVSNCPNDDVDPFGLQGTNDPSARPTCFCRCARLKSPTKGFKPDPEAFSIKHSIDQVTGQETSYYGFTMPVEWELVEGSSSGLCTYHVIEKADGITGTRPTGKIPASQAVDMDYPDNPHKDFPAVPLSKEGDYSVKVKLKATYKCKGSDSDQWMSESVTIAFSFSFHLTAGDIISNVNIR